MFVKPYAANIFLYIFFLMTDSSVTESSTQSMYSTIDNSKGKQTNISPGQSLSPAKDKTSHRSTGDRCFIKI